ncbi:focadhesin isoform X1 [Gadus morhua]|uniref:focadhesin isoform X1 n=1 Tax=Gadus morhua TaxID=8049 RepID=UPI0011B49006|nr:focadhesin isoform X1 [Gadus morhua]
MAESLKTRFDFPNPIIQAQTARSLVAAVLKEKEQNGKISQSSVQGVALAALWEQCCGGDAGVRATCCHALVLLVEQGHADLPFVLNSILNLLPSASNVQGLIGALGKLLQMQMKQGPDPETAFSCPYSIRSNPHPYITALENRAECWPFLLLEIHHFIQEGAEREDPACVTMLTPFLRYLYCEPQRQPAHAAFRQNLLRLLLPVPAPAHEGGPAHNGGPAHEAPGRGSSLVHESLLGCFCQLVPHMQVDSMEAVLELQGYGEVLLPSLERAPGPRWRAESARLALLLLCACKLSLQLSGDCRIFLQLIHRLLPTCRQEVPVEEVLMGLGLLLLEAPADQQTDLLNLALSLAPEQEPLAPWGAPLLLLPVLQLLSVAGLVEPLAEPRLHRRTLALAGRVLRSAGRATGPAPQVGPAPQAGGVPALPPGPWYSELTLAVAVLRRVADAEDPAAAGEWLASVTSSLGHPGGPQPLPWSLVLVVAHLLTTGPPAVCHQALGAAVAIAEADPSKVPSLLPVLLFRLEKEREPSLSHALLYTLPKLGTHKFCVPQVLHVLQMLASAPNLRAVVMRLMTELWKKQDRVYPELQRVLGQPGGKLSVMAGRDAQWEMVLARAACLKDICRERPYQHGGDMLAAITHTLVQCTKADLATPATLALQGLQDLCRAEVVEMVSTWRALGPQLSCDSRPLVVKAVADLLALVPQLSAKSPEYQKLKEEVVSFLWRYAVSKEPETSSCGYKALAGFPEDAHTILHLPEPARPVSKPTETDEEEEKGAEEEEKDLSVPGSSYMKLLHLTHTSSLPAYELLLTSLVRQAMKRMPRGVHTLALRSGGGALSDQGKTMAGVPGFMLRAYEKNKQPGLKPGLAVGLLLSFELPVHTDRDGRPIVRFLVSRSRTYQQTLASLIHEVNIQPSEWHRALLLPQAWRGFMSQAFLAVIQGRRAELEMQQKQSKDATEELQRKQHFSWLWARDQLTDVIKSAAKDSPVVQGNCILALSGLAAALAKYESNLPTDVEGSLQADPDCIPTSAWLSMAMDTLLCIISSNYKARGQVFPWFLHRSYSGENTASSIARSCATLGLSLLVPVLVGWHREGVAQVLSTLRDRLPGGPRAGDSQAVQFHSGLALGMVLACLHRQNLSDLSAPVDPSLLWDAQEALEQCAFDPDLEYNTGCVLGLGLVLSARSRCGGSQGSRVVLTLDRLLARLQGGGGQGRMLQEVLAYAVACACVSGFSVGLVDASKAEEVMRELRTLTEESQQTPGFSLALGSVVHGLSVCGHGKAVDLLPGLLAAWIKILLAEGCPTMQRLAAVNGLVALVGSESYLIQLKSESEQSSLQQGQLNDVIRTITQIISFSGAMGLQSNSACLVGHLHLAHMTTSHTHTTVPQDFAYLPENSVLRALGDFLSQAGKKGPEEYPPTLVKPALASLASAGASYQYPPVNWSTLLSPLMRLDFREDVQHQCMVLAASQAQSSQSAALFLGTWLSHPLVHCLSTPTQAHLYETLGSWMKHVSEDKLQAYVESLAVQRFTGSGGGAAEGRGLLRLAVLRGLGSAMSLPNPPKHCWTLLCSTAEKIYGSLPGDIQDDQVDLYVETAKCLSEMSDTEIERVVCVTVADMEKSCFTLAYLTSQGRLPLLSLNDVLSAQLRGPPGPRVGWLLLQAFYQCRLAPGANTGVSKRMEWLLELMGHIRNVVYGTTAVECADIKLASDLLLQVFAAAVVSWGDHATPLLLGVRPQWLPRLPGLRHALYGEGRLAEGVLPVCLQALPHSLKQLLDREPWSGQAQKFLNWLLSIAEGPERALSTTSITTAKAALQALRSCADFRKKGVWTQAYGW